MTFLIVFKCGCEMRVTRQRHAFSVECARPTEHPALIPCGLHQIDDTGVEYEIAKASDRANLRQRQRDRSTLPRRTH